MRLNDKTKQKHKSAPQVKNYTETTRQKLSLI